MKKCVSLDNLPLPDGIPSYPASGLSTPLKTSLLLLFIHKPFFSQLVIHRFLAFDIQPAHPWHSWVPHHLQLPLSISHRILNPQGVWPVISRWRNWHPYPEYEQSLQAVWEIYLGSAAFLLNSVLTVCSKPGFSWAALIHSLYRLSTWQFLKMNQFNIISSRTWSWSLLCFIPSPFPEMI